MIAPRTERTVLGRSRHAPARLPLHSYEREENEIDTQEVAEFSATSLQLGDVFKKDR
jgi:hypothetical protein